MKFFFVFFRIFLAAIVAISGLIHCFVEYLEVMEFRPSSKHGMLLAGVALLFQHLVDLSENLESLEQVLLSYAIVLHRRILQIFQAFRSFVRHHFTSIFFGVALVTSCSGEIFEDLSKAILKEPVGNHWGIFILGTLALLKGILGLIQGLYKLIESSHHRGLKFKFLELIKKFLYSPLIELGAGLAVILVAFDTLLIEGWEFAHNNLHISHGLIIIGGLTIVQNLSLSFKALQKFSKVKDKDKDKKRASGEKNSEHDSQKAS